MNFIHNDDMYTLVDSNDKFEAFKYNYYLPLINSVSESVTEWDYSSPNPFVVQNELMKAATGVEDVLINVNATEFVGENMKDVDPSAINSATTFTVNKNNNGSEGKAIVKVKPEVDGNYYIYVGSTKLSALNIAAGELNYYYNSTSIQPFILDCGYLTTEDEIEVTYTVPASNNSAGLAFCAARLDSEKFDEAYNKIVANGTFNMTAFDETSLEGTINVTNSDSFLWTSIPYDESWEVALDGKVLSYAVYDKESGEITTDGDIVKVGGGLMGIKAGKGEHTVSLKYKAKGLSTGIMLTCGGIAILALAVIYKKWLRKFFEKAGFVPSFFREPDFEIE